MKKVIAGKVTSLVPKPITDHLIKLVGDVVALWLQCWTTDPKVVRYTKIPLLGP